ncbi:MAG: hypothetical protein NUV59_03725 [Patescibacteria group bacterium]|nr:hypothetical protein [Patescibacteria group bacterium]
MRDRAISSTYTPRAIVFERTDIWREGKWLDLWSVVHFLSGVSVALGLALLGFGMPAAFVISFLMLVAYEMWEAMVKIEETPQNRVMDVVVGMMSFAPTFLYFTPILSGDMYLYIVVFGIVLAVNIALATFGWLASHKAAVLEEKVRTEYEQRIEKLRARRARKRARRLAR